MKKIIAMVLMSLSFSVIAHGHRDYSGHGRYHGNRGWAAPVIIGATIGYEISRQQVITVPLLPPVCVEQHPLITHPVCSMWKEIMTPDGKIYRERTCTQ